MKKKGDAVITFAYYYFHLLVTILFILVILFILGHYNYTNFSHIFT
jgi:cbb3-type cytochrome oxidase subunit 3